MTGDEAKGRMGEVAKRRKGDPESLRSREAMELIKQCISTLFQYISLYFNLITKYFPYFQKE